MKRATLLSLFVATLAACAGGGYLASSPIPEPGALSGSFTLVLLGANHLYDVETIVILDREGDSYEILPFAPEFNYRVRKGVEGRDALRQADAFLKGQLSYGGYQVREIRIAGTVAGYEVRPLYRPFVYGRPDILDTLYRIEEGGRVLVYVRVDPGAEQSIYYGGGGESHESRD